MRSELTDLHVGSSLDLEAFPLVRWLTYLDILGLGIENPEISYAKI